MEKDLVSLMLVKNHTQLTQTYTIQNFGKNMI